MDTNADESKSQIANLSKSLEESLQQLEEKNHALEWTAENSFFEKTEETLKLEVRQKKSTKNQSQRSVN